MGDRRGSGEFGSEETLEEEEFEVNIFMVKNQLRYQERKED
jgi:hypothetical protein